MITSVISRTNSVSSPRSSGVNSTKPPRIARRNEWVPPKHCCTPGPVARSAKAASSCSSRRSSAIKRSQIIYDTVDNSGGWYRSPVEQASRSRMNVVWRLPSEDLEKKFVAEGKEHGMTGLKGHRSVGGIRVSTYNAVSLDWVRAVTDLMKDFAKRNG